MSMIGKYDEQPSTWMRFCYNVMSSGNIPQHVAFIMDGNRRYAKKQNISRKDGHSKGFDKLTEVLHWCHELGIPEVTLYAFSLENFKREPAEVKALMGIFKEKIERLLQEEDKIMAHGVCIRFIGDVSRFDAQTQVAIAKVVKMSEDNTKSTLNIAMAYTSRDEITNAITEIALGMKEGLLLGSDIDEELVERCFYTNQCRPIDLLIRTSGEVRLSDFLLWQCTFSTLCFVDPLWPDLTVWTFFLCILKYQLQYDSVNKAKKLSKLSERCSQMEIVNQLGVQFSSHVDVSMTETFSQPGTQSLFHSTESMEDASREHCDGCGVRKRKFLRHLQQKRTNYFLSLLENS